MFNPLGFISKIIKSSNQKELDRMGKIVDKINLLEENIKILKDEDFPKKTIELKEKIKKGQNLGEILPDALLVLGDTNSCLSVIPAKRRKIPIFHMEAGNRCFDQRVPEEINRRIVDHTADINLTYSSIAREYLLWEGLAPDTVIKTGSPMFEVLNTYRDGIESSEILKKLSLKIDNYFVVSAHREENVDTDKNINKLVTILNQVAESYDCPVIVSTHPRTRNKINKTGAKFNSLVKLMKPLGFHDYNNLQKKSKAVLSDCGTISE